MTGESNLGKLLKTMKPRLNVGEYVFCTINDLALVDLKEVLLLFREEESTTIILRKDVAEALNFDCTFIASWITLTVHSSLEAVGLTAAFSRALANHNISCNVVAAYYHDHIFVAKSDVEKAMTVLNQFAEEEIPS